MSPEALRAIGIEIYDRWTVLWNLRVADVAEIMAPAFVLRYAQRGTEPMDRATRPEDLVEIIKVWHRKRPGILFKTDGLPVVDLQLQDGAIRGLIARPYLVSFDGEDGGRIAFSGTDILRVDNRHIVEVWSVSAGAQGRRFYREER